MSKFFNETKFGVWIQKNLIYYFPLFIVGVFFVPRILANSFEIVINSPIEFEIILSLIFDSTSIVIILLIWLHNFKERIKYFLNINNDTYVKYSEHDIQTCNQLGITLEPFKLGQSIKKERS